MIRSLIFVITIVICLQPVLAQETPGWIPISLGELEITIPSNASREVAYTNKTDGVFYTETNGIQRNGWQGWRIMSQEILEGYSLKIGDTPLESQNATAHVFPHLLIRNYPNKIKETFILLDTIDAFIVQLESLKTSTVSFQPRFTDMRNPEQCITAFENNTLLISRKAHQTRNAKENYPVWIGITCATPKLLGNVENSANAFSPMSLETRVTNREAMFVVVAGDTKEQTIKLAQQVTENYELLIVQRRKRMETLLNSSYLRTNDEQVNKAINWAKISLDALIMNQGKKGIFAGLPWFDNYWGRDTYITLPGATLVTGNYSDAKEILKSFADWQDTSAKSTNYGRIPNLVTTNSIAYNTSDGTPRFVIALYDYFRYSLDDQFIHAMYPTIKRSIEGTLKYHTDSLYFLTHADAESWMDAVGTDGAWSPRGNRANDIQMLWYKQLNVGFRVAEFMNDREYMEKLGKIILKVQSNFNKFFIDTASGMIYDHLKPNGKPDLQLRPNAFFTYNLLEKRNAFAKPFSTLTNALVFQHGVASLSPKDANFHPFHHYEPNYVQDAAYHNGIIWTWLSGAWIDVATEFGLPNLAYKVTSTMTQQILNRGAVGTLSELQDVFPREKETLPRLSGTYSQAWSLAEYIRNWYQSYLGINVNANAFKTSDNIAGLNKSPHILLSPHLPKDISTVDAIISIGTQRLRLRYVKQDSLFSVAVIPLTYEKDLRIDFLVPSERMPSIPAKEITLPMYRFTMNPNKTLSFSIENDVAYLIRDSVRVRRGMEKRIIDSVKVSPFGKIVFVSPKQFSKLTLAESKLDPNIQSLKKPEHTTLTNEQVVVNRSEKSNTNVLYVATDPKGDDIGTSNYTYPQNPNLQKGSLDITKFEVSSSDKDVYFYLEYANLSNPGWHPEYGYQLTFTAIAIDKDGKPNSGETNIGANSNYSLPPTLAFENIIYVGGGVKLLDTKKKILAEYQPISGDEKNPLGSIATQSIYFKLPKEILGTPSQDWKYTVLVGCQDDHGGAGIGEFRAVEATAGEWIGGNKKNPSDPNVYDIILPPSGK